MHNSVYYEGLIRPVWGIFATISLNSTLIPIVTSCLHQFFGAAQFPLRKAKCKHTKGAASEVVFFKY